MNEYKEIFDEIEREIKQIEILLSFLLVLEVILLMVI